MENNINSKIAANGVITYLFMFVSWLLLFNKTDKNINNDFVKSHIKSSSILHSGFIITYIIFIHYSLFGGISIYGFSINHLIAKTIFLILLGLLLLGIYKAHNKQYFFSTDIIGFIKNEKITDINNDEVFDEKDKLTIFLSYIPFVGYYNYSKYKNNLLIQNSTKLNLYITLILTILYINNYINLSNLFLLIYSIFIVFVGINIFTQDKITNINLNKIPDFEKLSLILKTSFKYIKNYFKNNDFKNFGELLEEKKKDNNKEESLEGLKDIKLPKFLIYIPFVNLIFIFYKNSKQKYHINNGITITFLIILILFFNYLNYINTNLYILFIFPIIYGLGYLKNNNIYKMPFIYEINILLNKIINIILFRSKQINEIRKKEESVSLKILK